MPDGLLDAEQVRVQVASADAIPDLAGEAGIELVRDDGLERLSGDRWRWALRGLPAGMARTCGYL